MIREIDYSKYDYAKVGHYSNVVMELPKNRSREISSETQLCSFMDALILSGPSWWWIQIGTAALNGGTGITSLSSAARSSSGVLTVTATAK